MENSFSAAAMIGTVSSGTPKLVRLAEKYSEISNEVAIYVKDVNQNHMSMNMENYVLMHVSYVLCLHKRYDI